MGSKQHDNRHLPRYLEGKLKIEQWLKQHYDKVPRSLLEFYFKVLGYALSDPIVLAENNWQYEKGLFIIGQKGCGKTSLMDHFRLWGIIKCPKVTAHDLRLQCMENGAEALKAHYHSDKRLFIDDVAMDKETKYYGSKMTPVEDLLYKRHEYWKKYQKRTFCTSDRPIVSRFDGEACLMDLFDDRVIDRIYESFNVVEMWDLPSLRGVTKRKEIISSTKDERIDPKQQFSELLRDFFERIESFMQKHEGTGEIEWWQIPKEVDLGNCVYSRFRKARIITPERSHAEAILKEETQKAKDRLMLKKEAKGDRIGLKKIHATDLEKLDPYADSELISEAKTHAISRFMREVIADCLNGKKQLKETFNIEKLNFNQS